MSNKPKYKYRYSAQNYCYILIYIVRILTAGKKDYLFRGYTQVKKVSTDVTI